ncbi:hypothetical protein ABZ391_27465, partial [Kitasatospora cineracea]
ASRLCATCPTTASGRPRWMPIAAAVGGSLLASLAHFAGDAWTPEIEAAWTALYGVITDVMSAAMTEEAAG